MALTLGWERVRLGQISDTCLGGSGEALESRGHDAEKSPSLILSLGDSEEGLKMGQTFSLATLSAGSAGIDVPELSDLIYEKSLGSARFMKSIRARNQNGLVVVKLVMKPYPQLDLGNYVRRIRCE